MEKQTGSEGQSETSATCGSKSTVERLVMPSPAEMAEANLLIIKGVRDALRDYHYAMDSRQHGGSAAHAVVYSLQILMGMPWIQGEEKKRRESEA